MSSCLRTPNGTVTSTASPAKHSKDLRTLRPVMSSAVLGRSQGQSGCSYVKFFHKALGFMSGNDVDAIPASCLIRSTKLDSQAGSHLKIAVN